MTKKVDAWMPVQIGPYVAATGHLTNTEHGMYFLLMMHAWNHGGALPADLDRWRNIVRADPKQWAASRDTIVDFWDQQEDGTWRQKRLDAELAKAKELTSARSESGKKGLAKRWQNDSKPDSKAEANGIANALPIPKPLPEPKTPESNSAAVLATARDSAGTLAAAALEGLKPPREPLLLEEARITSDDNTPAGILASVCVANSIRVNAFHPLVVDWARDGVTVERLKNAIATARMRKPLPAKIPPAYLDTILQDDSKPRADNRWTTDDQAAIAKGRELGIEPKRGEDFPSFRGRIREALHASARRQVSH